MIQLLLLAKDFLANKYFVGAIGISILVGVSFSYGTHIEKTRNNLIIKNIKIEHEKEVLKKEAEVSDWKTKSAEIKTIEVIRWKERNVYIEKKRDDIKSRIEEELKDESKHCVIGPNFIRLHNDSTTTSNGNNP